MWTEMFFFSPGQSWSALEQAGQEYLDKRKKHMLGVQAVQQKQLLYLLLGNPAVLGKNLNDFQTGIYMVWHKLDLRNRMELK